MPWDREARYRLPVAVWRDLMEAHFPGSEWVRMHRDTVEALAHFRHVRGLTSWDDAVGDAARRGDPVAGAAMTLALARLAADAVLYEGYLLYPYRSTAAKNQVRWQFGVLGPPGAADAGIGEEAGLAVECLLRPDDGAATVTVHLRFLQLQRRQAERARADGSVEPVGELRAGDARLDHLGRGRRGGARAGHVPGDRPASRGGPRRGGRRRGGRGAPCPAGRLVRRRDPLHARVSLGAEDDDGLLRLRIAVTNTAGPATDKDAALRSSLIGAHLLLAAAGARFVSVIDPPADARAAAGRCSQHRCWPVLAGDGGPQGQTSDVVLAAPIILYDHPAVAPESVGPMFDSTEIDEILTLRVLTLTDEEKAQARATDARAAAVIDRCEQMSPAELQRLHGILRNPSAVDPDASPVLTGDAWWAAEAAAPVSPETDAVLVAGARVARGSLVRLRPSRRADAQDMFLAGREARVTRRARRPRRRDVRRGDPPRRRPARERHGRAARLVRPLPLLRPGRARTARRRRRSRPARGEPAVRAIGILTTVLTGLVAAGAVVIGVRSVPDVKRYLAMRRM